MIGALSGVVGMGRWTSNKSAPGTLSGVGSVEKEGLPAVICWVGNSAGIFGVNGLEV